MTIDLTHVIYLAVAAVVVLLVFFPKIRSGVAVWIRQRIGGAVDNATTPREKAKDQGEQAIATQKQALKDAVALLKQQKENVVTVTARATTQQNKLREAQTKVEQAIKDYNDGKELGMSAEQLNELALKVSDARQSVQDEEANLALAAAAAKNAASSLNSARQKVAKLEKTIGSNEAKLVLADTLNTQTELDELTGSIDTLLSETARANETVDRILAEAQARQKVGRDQTAEELERRRREKQAREERERLDGTGSGAPASN